MGFLFFQNKKCVAGFAVLLAFEFTARGLRCQAVYRQSRQG